MLHLRELILRGELAPGERLREAEVAARLGMSRTPIRQALPALAQEGLLVKSGSRGYAVRGFTAAESLEALELRALLEGVAARSIAEHGASKELLAALHECLADGDAIFVAAAGGPPDEVHYAQMNDRFHSLILEGAGKPLLASLAARCNVVPFTHPLTIVFSNESQKRTHDLLFYAHRQHHAIVAAIEAGRGDRAEFLFREHAETQQQSQTL
jgi:GntR family transcriptional regulator of vanillate catabolism